MKDYDINLNLLDLSLDEKTKSALYDNIVNDIKAVEDYFLERFEEGEQNYNYYKGNQWTEEEKRKHYEQFRRVYVFNEIFNKIDHIIGTENTTRIDTVLVPREPNDAEEVEILNIVLKWIEQINNLHFVQTEVFTDALIRGVGFSALRWKFEDVEFGYPEIISIPPYEIVWDISSKDLSFHDARWLARIQYLTKQSLKELFPLHSDIIESQSRGNFDAFLPDRFNNFPYYNELYHHRYLGGHSNEEDEVLPLIEYYDYIVNPTYIVYDDIKNEDIKFNNLKDAQDFYRGKKDAYEEAGYTLINPDGEPALFLYTINEKVYRQTLIIGNEVIEHTDLATPFFPYFPCFAFFMHGDYWSFVRHLISPQDLINRSFSQLDYQLGASEKGITTVIKSLLDKSVTLESFTREYSKTKPIIPVLSHDAIRIHPPEQANAQLYQQVNFGMQRIIEYAGGHNILGYTEKAGESGRAVAERAQQAGIARLPLFDKLQIWRMEQAKAIVWYIKNVMNIVQISRILGDEKILKFKKPLPEIMASLKEIQYDIIVDETSRSESIRERYFEQLKNMFMQFPTAPEVVVPTLIEYSNLPELQKKELLKRLEFYQTYSMQKQQMMHEENLRRQAEDVVKRKMVRQQLQEELQVPERLPTGEQQKNK